MAMVASGMANDIKTAMDAVVVGLGGDWESADPADFADAFDTAASTYLENNCMVTYSWSATLPASPFTPDPVTSFDAHINFSSFSIGNAVDIDAWALLLQGAIMGAVIAPDIYVPPFALPPMTFLLTGALTLTQSGETEYLSALTYICDEIITWIKTLINPTPVAGTHTPCTLPTPGAIMTSIS